MPYYGVNGLGSPKKMQISRITTLREPSENGIIMNIMYKRLFKSNGSQSLLAE